MPAKNEDLHGFVPDKADVALLIIDMINDFSFKEGKDIFKMALPAAKNIAKLKQRAKKAGVPVIYVNDNHGKWQSEFSKVIEHVVQESEAGREIVEILKPEDNDYYVLKPKHSGFYSTVLDVLLDYLKVKALVLTGLSGNICVFFTANDAFMRDYYLYVPEDCVISNTIEDNYFALNQMEKVLKADIRSSNDLDWERIGSKVRLESTL